MYLLGQIGIVLKCASTSHGCGGQSLLRRSLNASIAKLVLGIFVLPLDILPNFLASLTNILYSFLKFAPRNPLTNLMDQGVIVGL